MFALTYRLRLEEPTLAGRPGGDANTVWSYDYLPGSTVRGAVLGQLGFPDSLAERILSGDVVRFLNAHPAVSRNGQWRRSLPVPLTWRSPKAGGNVVVVAKPGHETAEESRAIAGWFVPCSNPACLVEPDVMLTVHHQRHRGLGRPSRESPDDRDPGTIYRYASLAPEQHFVGAVTSEDRSALEQIEHRALNGRLRIGKARRGYGAATVTDAQIIENWKEIDSSAKDPAEFMVTLLSPALFMTDRGVPALRPSDEELQHALGQTATVVGVSAVAEQVGGFNRKWNLPLPSSFAAAEGSTYHIRCGDKVKSFDRLVDDGLGERRNEGFGRVAVDLAAPEETRRTAMSVELDDSTDDEHTSNDDSKALLERLQRRLTAAESGDAHGN